jgi:hypothetical protein
MKLEGKYSIELFKPDGEGDGLEQIRVPNNHSPAVTSAAHQRGAKLSSSFSRCRAACCLSIP